MRLSIFALLCLANLAVMSPARTVPLAVGPLDQVDPDIYGNYVIYRDFRNAGKKGAAVVAYELTTGAITIVNPTCNADNRPAVGEDRVVWCETQDGVRSIVSSVIGSDVEDVITRDTGSSWGLDVNNRWAMWYEFDRDHVAGLRVYNFTRAETSLLEMTEGLYDIDAHIDHFSDRALIRASDGSYAAVDLASGNIARCTQAEYNASLHSYYKGWHVWEVQSKNPADGSDIYISSSPEPSSLTAFLVGIAALGVAVSTSTRKRR